MKAMTYGPTLAGYLAARLRRIQMIEMRIPLFVFPAQAATHFWHGHRPSPV
jgi:hypothetical protein